MKKHPGAEDVLKHFTDKDQLYYAVSKLGPDDFVNRFAYNNKEAGLNIYSKVLADMNKPEPIRSIYAERITSEQEPPMNIKILTLGSCLPA